MGCGVVKAHVRIPPVLAWELDNLGYTCMHVLASFPGPCDAFGSRFSVLQATKSWVGPGNEAIYVHV